ncbi:bifunctional DNA primase/polymerase [Brevibacterium sp. 50QC2O2]|uniref:bifunctional DNA primase/polymerase n=1 Tax=unclassified Brevibacterium TaxID=2614124 RepID=UPI00211B8229|nr:MULTISPECIES: bifunctional DNA primase/polymerase [unclassified Brevibacterium]MCQ9367622.1 bifunctional DNA primase/polymerase [Brevibacterium sp. 91QC2O2]MCQ9389018.1 bifunctional DNA primase/polymerase [Brevibacterium sp. 50QC2O2]
MPGLSAFTQTLMRLPPGASLAEAAMALASAGIPVFPVAVSGKEPLTRHGFHDATTNLAQIRHWWASAPGANVGMPTGAASGVVVVDVDVHGPADGYVALDRADHAGLLTGWEALVQTPTNGLHAYYPATPGTEQRSWQVARAGIDFRGDGGYIIVPPSSRVIDGQRCVYRLEQVTRDQTQPLDAGRLHRFLDPPPPRAHGSQSQAMDRGVNVERLAAWVGRLQEGERNYGLFWAACTMAEHHVPPGQTLDVLTTAGGQAGLSVREVTVTVRSAYRTVTTAPTSSPMGSSPAPVPSLDRSPPLRAPLRSLS